MAIVVERGGEAAADEIEEALRPPNKINPATGVPYGWSEDDELSDLDSLLTG